MGQKKMAKEAGRNGSQDSKGGVSVRLDQIALTFLQTKENEKPQLHPTYRELN
jgi:hypothetical protein